jgi:hypothetical protein
MATTKETPEAPVEAPVEAVAEAPPPAAYYKVRNLSMYSIPLEKGVVASKEEGIANLSEVTSYIGILEELGVAE